MHLWKQLYLQRFDDFPSLWEASNDSSFQEEVQENQHEHEQNALALSSSSTSASSVASSSKHAASSIMSLVQLRDRAARLYAGDPTNHGPITLNFNAALSALLSVIDTAVPHASDPCRNSTWLDDSILSSGQPTWSEWVFPRSIMNSLDEFKIEAAAASRSNKRSQSPQERKRRRLTATDRPADSAENKQDTPTQSPKGSPSRRRSSLSKSTGNNRPDSIRRRSARLLKLIYPESLHGLVDEGIDIDALAQPQMRLAARIHCLHGIRAWKDSQKQRLTASPQEIANQRQQDGLANEGAAQASAENQTTTQNASTSNQTETNGQQSQDGQDHTETRDGEGQEETGVDRTADASEAAAEDGSNAEEEEEEDDDDDDDDESFDEPPAAILRFRPRMFGPSFGFCNAPDEEDEVRARMRHRVYDSGYYGWSNGFGPLHAWRYDPHAQDHEDDEDAEEGQENEDEQDADDDVAMADAGGYGSEDGDDDALREAAELSDGSEDIPDDPVPIEIEVGRDEDDRRTFQVADRYGNPIEAPSASANNAVTRGWDSSDDEGDAGQDAEQSSTDRTPFQPPDLGTYDADTHTYTFEGHLPIGIVTGSRHIQVTVGDTIDFVATGDLNVRFIRPGMLAETMRVTSGTGASNGRAIDDDEAQSVDFVVDEEDVDDDDYDEDADDWNDYGGEDEDDDNFGPFFDMFRPLSGVAGYRGCRADDEIKHLVEQRDAEPKQDDKDNAAAEQSRKVSLRRKSVHWELVEAIMVVMYANLKEAIWLENWGVGIRIPKIYDDAGIMTKDPMERREFLDFPTGWISSLPNPIPSKLHVEDISDQSCRGKEASPMETTPKVSEGGSSDSPDAKPHDWARCESFWAGTYAFLDYSHFVDFNVRMARRRREAIARAETVANGHGNGRQTGKGNAYPQSTPKPSLVGQEEAVGDCLQLRLELLPKSQQPAYNADEEGQEDDEDYPTLFFRGTTVTYWGNEAPMPRSGVHGKVRPVYAREEDVDEILSKGPRGKKKIEGIHWSLTHVYEGEDRWQLEGIQPGPPGTRAPIFGIWTDALHEEESPNGPFVYWRMDERPWKEIERINRQDAHDAAAARAAANR
ncbi:hypothetical protein NDA16_003374 [Ustilago loliicola]|nr:hypothetical protein NDA16_003374 [Ustilago loliicola]